MEQRPTFIVVNYTEILAITKNFLFGQLWMMCNDSPILYYVIFGYYLLSINTSIWISLYLPSKHRKLYK